MEAIAIQRADIGQYIAARLRENLDDACRQWEQSAPVHHFFVDDILPEDLAMSVRRGFPEASTMMLRKSLRELKYVSAQMNQHAPILEEVIFAFQQPEIVDLIARITRLSSLYPDEHLYAGGISMMGRGHFLNPHLDNSHDKDRQRYRVLNLLYYVSPGWRAENGGNLEVWPQGPKGEPVTIVSRFNRLAVMITNQHSWHSVSPNLTDDARCCVSNYYFSDHPAGDAEYFHPTSFRGRPEQPVRDVMLRADATARGLVRKVFPKGVVENRQVYRKGGKE